MLGFGGQLRRIQPTNDILPLPLNTLYSTATMSVVCARQGCGLPFSPETNPSGACSFHPGAPVGPAALLCPPEPRADLLPDQPTGLPRGP